MPQTNRTPVDGGDRGSGKSTPADKLNSRDNPAKPENQALLDELAEARRHLERRTFVNETMCNWRDELQCRITREELRVEACGFDAPISLSDEIAHFRRTCSYFGWRGASR